MTTRFYGFGINDYPGVEADLNGCVNDIILARNLMMRHFKIDPQYVHLRTDKRATRDSFEEKLAHMVRHTKAGDTAIFWYSGHGTQVRDRNEDELNDYLDEALVPYDYDSVGLLLDDVIGGYFEHVNADARLIIVMDCCFAGTITRGGWPFTTSLMSGSPTEDHRTRRNRFLQMPLDYLSRETGAEALMIRPDEIHDKQWEIVRNSAARDLTKEMPSHYLKVNRPGTIMLSASTDRQTSADAYFRDANAGRGAYHGAFTFSLCSTLHSANFNITYTDLIAKAGAWLDSKNFAQTPLLECDEESMNLLFGR